MRPAGNVVKLVYVLALAIAAPVAAHGQSKLPDITGTWEADASQLKKIKSGPTKVIIRADSSASWGKEHVRWRWSKGNDYLLALGGEWVPYTLKVSKGRLTISGEDLPDPVVLTRVGPATARPDGVGVPPDPDTEE